jgi:hypothetical protein
MQPLRTRSALLWLACAALAVALTVRSGWMLRQLQWPRSIWPLLIPAYACWISLDVRRTLRPGVGYRRRAVLWLGAGIWPWILLFALAVVCGAGEVYGRWSNFRSQARFHYLQEQLCRSSARGERGDLILHGSFGCQIATIPEVNAWDRVGMLAAAEEHAHLRRYWESRW